MNPEFELTYQELFNRGFNQLEVEAIVEEAETLGLLDALVWGLETFGTLAPTSSFLIKRRMEKDGLTAYQAVSKIATGGIKYQGVYTKQRP